MGHLSVILGALHRLAFQIQHLPWHSRPYRPLQRNAWASLVQTSLWTQTSGFRLQALGFTWPSVLGAGYYSLHQEFRDYSLCSVNIPGRPGLFWRAIEKEWIYRRREEGWGTGRSGRKRKCGQDIMHENGIK